MCGPAEDSETIARRYAAVPRNQRTFSNWLREFTQFMIAPLNPGFNLDRYDRELRRPFPSKPKFAPEAKVWRARAPFHRPCRVCSVSPKKGPFCHQPPSMAGILKSKKERFSCHNK